MDRISGEDIRLENSSVGKMVVNFMSTSLAVMVDRAWQRILKFQVRIYFVELIFCSNFPLLLAEKSVQVFCEGPFIQKESVLQ